MRLFSLRPLLAALALTAFTGCGITDRITGGDDDDDDDDSTTPPIDESTPTPDTEPAPEPTPEPAPEPAPEPDDDDDDDDDTMDAAACEAAWDALIKLQKPGTVKEYEYLQKHETEHHATTYQSTMRQKILDVTADAYTVETTTKQTMPVEAPETVVVVRTEKTDFLRNCGATGIDISVPSDYTVEILDRKYESVTVPAGTYDTLRVDMRITGASDGWVTDGQSTVWTMKDGSGILVKSESSSTSKDASGATTTSSSTTTLTVLQIP